MSGTNRTPKNAAKSAWVNMTLDNHKAILDKSYYKEAARRVNEGVPAIERMSYDYTNPAMVQSMTDDFDTYGGEWGQNVRRYGSPGDPATESQRDMAETLAEKALRYKAKQNR